MSTALDEAARRENFEWNKRSAMVPVTLPQDGYPLRRELPLPAALDPGVVPGPAPLGWQVILQQSGSGDWQWAVVPGVLYNTPLNGGSELTVTGTLALGPIDPTDAAWSNIGSAPAKIWLEIAFTSWPAVDSAYISTTDFDGGALEYVSDGGSPPTYTQTFARRILGQVPAYNAGGSPQLITQGLGIIYLTNGGDSANLSSGGTPQVAAIIFPRA